MKKAFSPNEISILFLEYLNAGNLEGVVSLFEPNAIIATGSQVFVKGTNEIKAYFEQLISHNPQFNKVHHDLPIINGDIALTSTRVPNALITIEVCRKQKDGSWLWFIDQPNIFNQI
ncbi:MAG: YybH family protein [Sphingobacterium siyangense]